MKTRVAGVLIAAILIAGLGSLVSFSGEATAKAGPCPSFKLAGHGYSLEIERGDVSCRRARSVLRDLLAGKGVEHGHGPQASRYWTLRGWTCELGTGASCTRGTHGDADRGDDVTARAL